MNLWSHMRSVAPCAALLALGWYLLPAAVEAQTPTGATARVDAPAGQDTNPRAARLARLFRSAHDARQFHGAVLIADGDNVILSDAFGMAEHARSIANHPGMPFPIHSITKSFTAILIMQLVEEGRLRLDSRLHEWFPDFRAPGAETITLHHLLTHTSGLPEFMLAMPGWMDYAPPAVSADSVLTFAAGLPLEFQPGTGYAYSNTGFILLAGIIEETTGRPYADLLMEKIFEPLGMHHTRWTERPDSAAGAAVQYLPGGERPAPSYAVFGGYAGIVSTLTDLLRFARALGSDALLNAGSWRRVFTPHASPDDVVRPHPSTRFPYGYGLALSGPPGAAEPAIALHGGLGYGGSALFMHSLADDWTVVFWNNTGGLPPQIPGLLEALQGGAGEANGTPPATTHRP